MARTIYHIEFAKTWLGLSGGEKCMIEQIKYFVSKGENNVYCLLPIMDEWPMRDWV